MEAADKEEKILEERKKKIKDFQTRYNEAKNSGDQNRIKKLEEEHKEETHKAKSACVLSLEEPN